MTLLMGQLQLLALPLLYNLGPEYDESRAVEHIIVKYNNPENPPNWSAIDERISLKESICPCLQLVQVPTFKPMTEILVKMAKCTDLRVLEISKQRELQMKVSISEENLSGIEKLKDIIGCQVMFTFQFPSETKRKKNATSVSLQVTVPYILSVIRFCLQHKFEIEQIYDTY